MKELDIKEVASILNRSTKSIRNYIKSNKLKARKIPSKKGLQYMFTPKAVEAFAKKYLSLSLSISSDISQSDNEKVSTQKKTLAVDSNKFKNINSQNFIEILVELEEDRIKIVKEFGEYKAQLAYQVGQLESDLKKLKNIDNEKSKLEKTNNDLQKKLDILELEYEIRDNDARELLKIKEFYENRKWWHFWKNNK